MFRSAIAALAVVLIGYGLLNTPTTDAQSYEWVSVPSDKQVTRTVREDGSVMICDGNQCTFEPAPSAPTAPVESTPVYVSYSQPATATYTTTSYGSAGSTSVSYGSAGSTVSYGCTGSAQYTVRTPVRNTVRYFRTRQPVRTVLRGVARRVFCRRCR